MSKLKIGIASDHRGFHLKEIIKEYLNNKNDIEKIIDLGANSTESCDYPDYAYKLGQSIKKKEVDFGIAICGSGIGISIALNKINGVYCAKVNDNIEAMHTRNDNNTNCVALGETMKEEEALKIVDTFIHTEYSNLEKHNRRNKKIKEIENNLYD